MGGLHEKERSDDRNAIAAPIETKAKRGEEGGQARLTHSISTDGLSALIAPFFSASVFSVLSVRCWLL